MIDIIKLGKWIYINPLVILLAVFCYINRNLELLIISYAIMTLHELAHFITAVCIGLVPSHIAIEPFGLNLRLKNQIVYSLYDEILLYISGPCVNLIFALLAYGINTKLHNIWIADFALKNISLFIINILPIVPLDGGIITKKILTYYVGCKTADNIMRVITLALIGVLVTFGVILTLKSQFNFSIVFLCVFLIMNIFTQKEKYNVDFVKELMFYKHKMGENKNEHIKLTVADSSDCVRKSAERFTKRTFSIVFVLDKNACVENIVTEPQIIDGIVKKGGEITFADIHKK